MCKGNSNKNIKEDSHKNIKKEPPKTIKKDYNLEGIEDNVQKI